ncbi:MAG TPA: cupredoxin domain-containing protein [Nitrososphaeraceae archaeon]|jgi:plastocyanin|nr:cupredoxin domain-containing protein [Nitrososphaeraceae archaeon]
MTKRAKQRKVQNKKFPKGKMIIGLGAAAAIISIIAYFGINSLIPVNGTTPIFAPPRNTFIKATHSPQSGFVFTSQSTSGSKRSLPIGFNSPTLTFKKGGLESIHLINEDGDSRSKHNLNIDEFNVHTRDLGYFESQTITFIANKDGTFKYYCTIHPEMRGTVIVEG